MLTKESVERQINMAAGAIENLRAVMDYVQPVSDYQMVIDRDEYEHLCCNQASAFQGDEQSGLSVTIPLIPSGHPDSYEAGRSIDISHERRYGLVDDMAHKPAVYLIHFDRFDKEAGEFENGNLFAGAEVALRNTDCVRVYASPHDNKEFVAQALKDILAWVERDWDTLASEALEEEKRYIDEGAKRRREKYEDQQSVFNDDHAANQLNVLPF